MSTRTCYDWSPLGYGSHPIPGDPDEVVRGARDFHDTARHLRAAAEQLARLESADQTQSKALDELDDDMRQIISSLWSVYNRYEEAADALDAYAPVLVRAQAQAERALEAAARARTEYEQAARTANDLYWESKFNFDPDQRREISQNYHLAKGRAENAEASLINAKDQAEDARADVEAAGNRAADAIETVMEASGLNDSLGDIVGQFAKDVWEAIQPIITAAMRAIDAIMDNDLIWDIVDWMALGLTVAAFVAALVVGWTGVGAGVAVLLFAVAKVLNVASAARNTYKLVEAGINLDGAGAMQYGTAIGLSLLGTKGLGKIFNKANRAQRVGTITRPGLISYADDPAKAYTKTGATRSRLEEVGLWPSTDARITDNLILEAQRGGAPTDRLRDALVVRGAEDVGNNLVGLGANAVTDRPGEPAERPIASGSVCVTGGGGRGW